MTDIDLIPPHYRELLRIRRWTRLFVISAITIIMLTLFTKGLFSYLINRQNEAIEGLQQTKTSVVNNEQVLDGLVTQKSALQHKLDILATLQNGPSTNSLFVAIDNAMSKDIWFQELSYTNRPETGKAKGETVNTGYFIVVPQGSEQAGTTAQAAASNKLLTKVEIKGQALSHTALASFVNRLNAQPVFNTVKIVNTQLRRYTRTEVVDFTLVASTQAMQESRK